MPVTKCRLGGRTEQELVARDEQYGPRRLRDELHHVRTEIDLGAPEIARPVDGIDRVAERGVVLDLDEVTAAEADLSPYHVERAATRLVQRAVVGAEVDLCWGARARRAASLCEEAEVRRCRGAGRWHERRRDRTSDARAEGEHRP